MAEDDETKPTPSAPQPVTLTAEQQAAIADHINRKAASPTDACSVCGSPENNVVENVYRTEAETMPWGFGGLYQPLVSTVCRNCGFVRFFNKNYLDALVPKSTEAAPPTAQLINDDGS